MDKTTQHLVDMAKEFVGPVESAGLVSVTSLRAANLRVAIQRVEDAGEQPPGIMPEGHYVVELLGSNAMMVALRITEGKYKGRTVFTSVRTLAPNPFPIKLTIEHVGEEVTRNKVWKGRPFPFPSAAAIKAAKALCEAEAEE